jgi:hypothetical protein
MLLRGLTVDRANNPVVMPVSLATRRSVVSRTGQGRSFPQNNLVTSN